MVSFKVEGPNLKLDLGLLKIKQFKKLAQQELNNTKDRLSTNIQQGKNADGKAMKKYSKSYRDAINKWYVKSAEGVHKGSTTVNLTVGGKMLKARQIKELSNGAELIFTGGHGDGVSNEELANYNLALRKGWHSLGKEDIKRIQKRVDAETKKIANKLIKAK